jgi:hypothetical protein
MLSSTVTLADSIKCYSNGKLIYSGSGLDVSTHDGLFILKMPDNTYLLLQADCVAKMEV